MKRSLIFSALLLLAWCQPVFADTGQIREVVKANGLHIVVFTAPTPIRAGEVEVVTLVTVEATGRPVGQYQLDVSVRSPDWGDDFPAMVSMGEPDPGTRFAYKSVVVLPDPGEWALLVEIRTPGRDSVQIPLVVMAGEPHPLWWQELPLLLASLPCLGLILARDSLLKRCRRGFLSS